jgi:putative ABC transport system permease protein
MKNIDVLSSAVTNTFRSKMRTTLTVLAIFIGAFTLTITSGLGTGINRYIDSTVSAIGADDVMTVTKKAENAEAATDGPKEYDPDQVSSNANIPSGPGQENATVDPITPERLTELGAIDGVLSVQPNKTVKVDYVQHNGGTKYQIGIGGFVTWPQARNLTRLRASCRSRCQSRLWNPWAMQATRTRSEAPSTSGSLTPTAPSTP